MVQQSSDTGHTGDMLLLMKVQGRQHSHLENHSNIVQSGPVEIMPVGMQPETNP